MDYKILTLAFLFLSCSIDKEELPIDSMPIPIPIKHTEEQIEYAKKRIEILKKRNTEREQFYIDRKIARKKFDSILPAKEKEIIDKIRNNYFEYTEEKERKARDLLNHSAYPASLKKLSSKLIDLEIKKWKNVEIGLNDMMGFVSKHKEVFNDIALKYDFEIMKIESEYSDKKKEFYERKMKEIANGEEKTVIQNMDGVDYYWGKMDNCMTFLLVNPEQ